MIDVRPAPVTGVADVVERLRRELTAPDIPAPLSTGLVEMDDLLHGLRPGRVYVVGGRPGAGKTALVLGIANAALAAGKTVMHRSLEMAADDIVLRLVARESRVALSDIRTRSLDPEDWSSWRRLGAAMDHIAGLPMVIDSGDGDSDDLAKWVHSLAHERAGLGLVVVDDLQRLALREVGSSRSERVEALMQRIRGIARDAEVPVIACAQCVRPVRLRDAVRAPEIGDLRDSDAIAANADVILLLAATEAGLGPGLAQLQVAKNRHGSMGAVTLAFIDHIVRFAAIACPT